MKRSARKDKRAYIDKLADDAEKAASKGDLNTVYKITKELCGKSTQIPPVKNAKGKVITSEREQAERWLEHFKEVLNRPKPNTAFEGIQQQNDLNINSGTPSKDEITKAIKSMKSGKASGIDEIQAELLKADRTRPQM